MTAKRRGNVFHIAGQRDETVVKMIESTLASAKVGEILGVTGVIDYGGGELEYIGLGTFAKTPGLGLLAATKLAKKYL